MIVPNPTSFDTDSLLDRRAHARRRGGAVKVRLSDYKAESRPIEGHVLDVSSGGLCLSVPCFIAAGTLLSVRPANAPELVPWVHVEVVYANPRDEHWVLGCQFTHLVPWSVRVLFG